MATNLFLSMQHQWSGYRGGGGGGGEDNEGRSSLYIFNGESKISTLVISCHNYKSAPLTNT